MSTAAVPVKVDSKLRQETQHMRVQEKEIKSVFKRCSQTQPVSMTGRRKEVVNTDARKDIPLVTEITKSTRPESQVMKELKEVFSRVQSKLDVGKMSCCHVVIKRDESRKAEYAFLALTRNDS